MAFIVADRVREISASIGTGVFNLSGSPIGYQTFSASVGNGNTTYYVISNPGVNEWEVGIGTVGAGTLTRTTVLASSNGGTAVNFTAGSKDVFVTYPAEAAVFADNTVTLTNKTFGDNPTISSGTANGVAYLNGSKVLTTGSALTFDGTTFAVTKPTAYSTRFAFDASYYTDIGYGGTNTVAPSNPFYYFNLNGSEQMRLTSTGLGIGTSSPAAKLHVVGAEVRLQGSASYYSFYDTAGTTRSGYIQNNSGSLSFVGELAQPMTWWTNNTLRATLDSSGNLGLGVTPSAWGGGKGFQIGSFAALAGYPNEMDLSCNSYFNGTNYIYLNSGNNASYYAQTSGQHQWYTAPSGTAGNAISFTQAMTLDASGNLGIGTSSHSDILTLAGGASGSYGLTINNAKEGGGTKAVFQYDRDNEIAVVGGNTTNGLNFKTQTGGNLTEKMRIDPSGNLLVNTTSTVAGSKLVVASGDANINGLTVGRGGGSVSTNTANGMFALFNNTTASQNTAVGYQAGYSNTIGTNITFVGYQAGYSNTASYNVGIGNAALYYNVGGGYNTAVGVSALQSNTTASNNTAVGYQAGYSNTTGTYNVALGGLSLNLNTTSSQQTALGYGALQNTTGANNTGVGFGAGYLITTGAKNTIIGQYTGNQGGLDIRTASNYIVLSDGDGNPRIYATSNSVFLNNNGTGTTYIYSTAASTEASIFQAQSTTSGVNARVLINAADAEGWNGNNTVLWVGRQTATNRSINAGGTINASGADYAEYMHKAGTFDINKGDICGIDANGKLTNIFAESISFVVKSTNPSYVGGDNWFNERKPDEKDSQEVKDAYQAKVDIARQTVDRIAFSGQVPVNVLGATAGQYIVPINDNGSIKGEAVSNPTFEQYQSAVGKVIAIEPDGRARIIVKVA